MSPKAFRLQDELKKSSESSTAPKTGDADTSLPRVGARASAAPSPRVTARVYAKASAEHGVSHRPKVPLASSSSHGASRVASEDESVAGVPSVDRIEEITPLENGELVSITFTSDGERCHVCILTEQYASLPPSLGEITPKLSDALKNAGVLCDAIRKGTELLGYGAMSRRRLSQKLSLRGFDRETVEAAVTYLDVRGLLPEADDAIRFAEQGVRKLWGPRRIREDLFARGFPPEAVTVALDSLEDVDFSANCARMIEKKYGKPPRDRAQQKKMIAALMRLGYTLDHIKNAMK